MGKSKKAVWVTNWNNKIQFYRRSPKEAQRRVSQLAKAGISLIIPNLDRGKGVYYFKEGLLDFVFPTVD